MGVMVQNSDTFFMEHSVVYVTRRSN